MAAGRSYFWVKVAIACGFIHPLPIPYVVVHGERDYFCHNKKRENVIEGNFIQMLISALLSNLIKIY
jgi:hypothetical protein